VVAASLNLLLRLCWSHGLLCTQYNTFGDVCCLAGCLAKVLSGELLQKIETGCDMALQLDEDKQQVRP
jgi:hypothetical protein